MLGALAAWWPVPAVLAAGLVSSAYFQPSRTAWGARVRHAVGFFLAIDFLALWLVPIVLQGAIYKQLTEPYLSPIYYAIDRSPALRWLAETTIYAKPKYSDYFATQLLFILGFVPNLAFIFYIQRSYGFLPWWALGLYYLNWVGIGSRSMGSAYFISHREGHSLNMYKPWLRDSFGNVFENWVGLFYGSVWNNFTTTHIALHHRLDSGQGDTLYCWDVNRSSWPDFLIYQCRGLYHMSGFAALYQFWDSGQERYFKLLRKGVVIYWVLLPMFVLWATRSPAFWFWVVLQPLFCMGFFLALLNLGFHAFIQNDENGNRIQCVESITLLGGQDDFFGENDHMAHHYHTHVYWRDLDELQAKQREEFAAKHASIFQDVDIFTFSCLVVLKAWPILAERYVDYSGTLTKAQTETMLMKRATRREAEHSCLLPSMPNPAKPKGYGPEPPPLPREGSASYHRLLGRLRDFQLGVADLLVQGLPPMEPKKWPAESKISPKVEEEKMRRDAAGPEKGA